ncbi:MAG TPA: FadR/GntR family transcriptional regulator [Candidatus Baltobacteraceae bacterium]|nr:FadR/GntR family transcriptional regulator [Candidatus Baltobacteraceae bacterium]
MNKVIESVSVVDAIERRIKDMISGGQINPGDQLPSERELQNSLGVSRLPLREALARLQALGLIRIRHGKGAFVERNVNTSALSDVLITFFPNNSEGRLRELVEARSFLEGELTMLATQRATAENLAKLRELSDIEPASVKDGQSLAEIDYAFHHEIARAARNDFLFLMHTAIEPHIRSFIETFAQSSADRASALVRNRELFKIIQAGDPAKAAESARAHLQPCLKSITRAVAQYKRRARGP